MSRLEAELYGQPEALERFLREGREEVAVAVETIRERKPDFFYIVGRGSSENAARYAQYVLGERAHFSVCLGNPSLFTHYAGHPDLSNAVVCAISQSGQSPDTCDVVEIAGGEGSLTLAITNDPESPLADAADLVILIRAKEKSLAATQTYSNSLAALSALAAELAGDKETFDELEVIPDATAATLEMDSATAEIADSLKDCDRAFVLGRGFNYGTAHEVALKLKELTYILAHPYSSAEFMHGPIAVVEKGFPVVIVAPSGAVEAEVPPLAEHLLKIGANLMIISDNDSFAMEGVRFLEMKRCPEWISPLVAIVRGQLLALRLCEAKGMDPDNPRGLKKITRTL